MGIVNLFDKIAYRIQKITDKKGYNLDNNKVYRKICEVITDREMKVKGWN